MGMNGRWLAIKRGEGGWQQYKKGKRRKGRRDVKRKAVQQNRKSDIENIGTGHYIFAECWANRRRDKNGRGISLEEEVLQR